MLDLDRIRNDPDELRQMLKSRFVDTLEADSLLLKDALRRDLAAKSLAGKARRNRMSQQIGELKQNGVYGEEVLVITSEMRSLGSEIAAMDMDIAELDDKLEAFLLSAPNYPHASVPVGKSDRDDEEVYHFGERHGAAREAKPFWNIGSELKLLDFDGIPESGNIQSAVYRGLGAKLMRAVYDFIVDTHIQAGCRKLTLPYPAISDEKHEGEPLSGQDQSIADLYRERMLEDDDLPIRRCAVSAGFHPDSSTDESMELLTICRPGDSYAELTQMAEQTHKALQLLTLSGRVMLRCTGRMPLCAAKTFGLEVWMPGSGHYVNLAEYSNCEAYLARRLDIRCREPETGETQLCHTLLGSGIAVHRTVAAILETHYHEDGSVSVPDCLQPYMHTDRIR